MVLRVVKTSEFRKFLESKGCRYDRTKASHEIWKCPKCFRSITFRGAEKTIPELHLRTNLATMGLKLKALYDWLD